MVPYSINELKRKVCRDNPRKVFLLYEGLNTETYLINPLLSSNSIVRSQHIIFKSIEKQDNDKGITDPLSLIKYAKKFISNEIAKKNFSTGRDKVMIVFDLDVFHNNQEKIDELLAETTNDIILCYTNPAIELFLLLTEKRGFEKYIEPNKDKILKNEFNENGDRYIAALAMSVLKIPTTKEARNINFTNVINNASNALIEERFLNNKLSKAAGQLTSNIGSVLSKLSKDDFDIKYD